MALRVRIGEAEKPQPQLLWDTVWEKASGQGDWALADAGETQNRGGLRAQKALHTAIILCLFTDRRIPDDHPLKKLVEDGDPRGWWGDDIDVRQDLDETELGSLLWVFERSYLDEYIRRSCEAIALEALQCLIDQGAAVKIDVQAFIEPALNRLDLAVQVYGRNGTALYDWRFDDVWRQVT